MTLPKFEAAGTSTGAMVPAAMDVLEALAVADRPKPEGMLRNEHVAQMRLALIALADEVRRLQHTEAQLVDSYVVGAIGDLAKQAAESDGAQHLALGLDRAHAWLRRWGKARFFLGATYSYNFPSIDTDPDAPPDPTIAVAD